MTEWHHVELPELFEIIQSHINLWEAKNVIPNIQKIGKIVIKQLSEYTDGKYRKDRNETIGFFNAIDKFSSTDLPLSLEHFGSLINRYKNRISPYPHYSEIKIVIPRNITNLSEIDLENIPTLDAQDNDDESSSLTLM